MDPSAIIERLGSYPSAVTAVLHFGRALWEVAFQPQQVPAEVRTRPASWVVIDEHTLKQSLADPLNQHAPLFLDALKQQNRFGELEPGIVGFHVDVFQPVALTRMLLGPLLAEHNLRYFVMQGIRHHYNCYLSPEISRLFYFLADEANKLRTSAQEGEPPKHWNYRTALWQPLQQVLVREWANPLQGEVDRALSLFVECCRAVNYFKASYRSGCAYFRATVDAEFLLSNLFGMPTNIRGFDDLFGGGGLMLTEAPSIRADPLYSNHLRGRTILITGRFGTGKTLLALKLAVEAACKGGVAWIMPLEQSAEECLYALESMAALPTDGSVFVATDVVAAQEALRQRRDNRGVLIILTTEKDSYKTFLSEFETNARDMEQYPLRMIVADPINSVVRGEQADVVKLRAATIEMIRTVKQTGTHVLLVGEEGSDPVNELRFEQNIADTVIRLSVQNRYGYAQRYIEIMKSRFQREQRGEHPFAILPAEGMSVSPSSAAVMSKIRARSVGTHTKSIPFGLHSLDNILGPKLITAGDIIAIQGPEGSFKTALGLHFLLGSTWEKSRSLLIAARDDEATVREMIDPKFIRPDSGATKSSNTLRICTFPRGYIDPGYILQRIDDELLNARRDGKPIDRIMIDDIAHWEMTCPLVRADETFSDTLIELLRRRNVTALLLCGELPADIPSSIQWPMLESADCRIELKRFVYRGINRIMLQILKTRGMSHERGTFELTYEVNRLEVRPSASLLRIRPTGEITPVGVRLFLHAETDMQGYYNSSLLRLIKPILSHDTTIETEYRLDISKGMRLAASSAVDELQILQLDEFQLPPRPSGSVEQIQSLYIFPNTLWDEKEWNDFVPRLRNRTYVDKGFFAVPLYENISLLAYRQTVPLSVRNSWKELAKACSAWEKANPSETSLYFDFPRGSAENYNCLFLEILFSLINQPTHTPLAELLDRDIAVEAALLFRCLARRAYFAHGGNDLDRYHGHTATALSRASHEHTINIEVDRTAMVWRHWYSTVNQMLATMTDEERRDIGVDALPGEICIAGEWYAGVPAYSAAPDVGLEILKLMTSHEAELERLRLGVGLPTRQGYYDNRYAGLATDIAVSPYFSMSSDKLKKLVNSALSRSNFRGYAQFAKELARALQRILEIPIPKEKGQADEEREKQKIRSIFYDLAGNIRFLGLD